MAVKNPLYPGYYPGEDIRPQRGGGGGRKREFEPGPTPDMVEKFMEGINESNFKFLNFPRWVWEEEKNALENAWRANYFAKDVISPAEAAAGGEEEVEDLPGSASVGGTLNPVEWIKDPAKQAKSWVANPAKSIFDKDDIYQKAKSQVWKDVFMVNIGKGFDKRKGAPYESPYHLKESPTLERQKATPSIRGIPAVLDDPNETVHFDKEGGAYTNKLYGETARSAWKYMGDSNSVFNRNKSFAKFNKNLLSALDTEFEIKKDSFLPNQKNVIEDFRKRVKVIDIFDDLGIVEGAGGGAEKISVNGQVLSIKNSRHNSINHTLGKISNLSNKDFFGVSSAHQKEIFKHLKNLDKSLEKAEGLLDGISGTKGLEKYVKNLRGTVKKGLDGDVVSGKVLKELGKQEKRLYKMTADGGLLGGFIRNTVDKNIRNPQSQLNKIIEAKDSGNNHIMSKAARRLNQVSNAMKRDWEWETANQIAQDLAKGNLPRQFIWNNAIVPRIEKWTPHYWVGEFMKRSHHLGFMVNQDALGNDPKIKPTFVGRLVEKYSPFIRDNKFKIKVAGTVYRFTGDERFKSVIEVAKLFNFKDSKFTQTDLLNFLNGISSDVFNKEDLENLYKFKEFLDINDTLRNAVGIKKLKDGTYVTSDRIKEFFSRFTDNELQELGLSPTLEKVGIVERYSGFLSKWQRKAYKSRFGKAYQATVGKFVELRERFANWLSAIIAGALDVSSGGLTKAIDWAVKIAIQYVLNKIGKVLGDFWKAARKLDFSDLIDDVDKALASVGRGLLGGFIAGCAPIFIILFLVFTVIISTVSSFPVGRIGEDATGAGSLFLTLDNFQADCSAEVENPSQAIGVNNSSSSVARSAFNIVEGLQRGFWCYFNRQPSYPELFDEIAYARDPFPPVTEASKDWDLLFWCTFLPWKAGANFPRTGSWARADGMEGIYREQRTFVSGSDAFVDPDTGATNVQAGDVVFINSGSSRSSNHVGMVYEVTRDYVMTVHSNTGLKVWAYTVGDDGNISGVGSHRIVGFGR